MSFEPENDPYRNQGAVPLGKEDESALNDLNFHAANAAAINQTDVKKLSSGELAPNDARSFEDSIDSVITNTGNAKVDHNSRVWLDEAVNNVNDQYGYTVETPEAAEEVGYKFVDKVNEAYTPEMSWHQGQDDLFGDSLDDLNNDNGLTK